MFLGFGLQKVFGLLGGRVQEPFTRLWFAGTLELLGAAIALGVLTRPVAFILSGEMAVAYFLSHAPRGFWPAQNFGLRAILFCFAFLFLVTAGAGQISLDRFLTARRTSTDKPVPV
jgi:putative oxidoreductase